ncbi:UNVERIFIED_ORG: pimeloyl-ACP methyl ester carboxylesterase [Actinomadura viridilutea]
MSLSGTPFVLLHGFWHGSWCWASVTAELAARGRVATAVDMAGHGLNARRPTAASARPFDEAAFAAAPSPVAGVSLDDAADLLTAQLKRLGRPCVLVAHSMGGNVATRVAEQAPDLVAHLVYVTAFMPSSGTPAGAYITEPENAGELVSAAVRTDPDVVGALRLDVASPDPAYRAKLREAFYNDIAPDVADAAMALLSPDGPIGIVKGSTDLTPEGWGSVPRTYVMCMRDNAIRPRLQERFITEADAAFPDNPTKVVRLDASHSPFLSQPERLAEILASIA